MDKKNILILKNENNSFERYFIEKMNNELIQTESIYLKLSKVMNKIRTLYFKFNLPFKSIWYEQWKYELDKYETIILFDYIFEKDIVRYIEKNASDKRLIFYYWNKINDSDIKIRDITKKFEYWSFDIEDCEKYDMKYNPQFYIPSDIKNSDIVYDVSFIGLDKGRVSEIIKLKDIFEKNNMNTKLVVKKDRGDKNKKFDYMYTQNFIEYNEVINLISKSRCLLDIVKQGQVGLTIRVLEALYYSKKLITNNKDIIKYDLYNPNNIFIIGVDDFSSIRDFIDRPYEEVDESIISKYSYDKWINEFIVKE